MDEALRAAEVRTRFSASPRPRQAPTPPRDDESRPKMPPRPLANPRNRNRVEVRSFRGSKF
eukprot:2264746-Alexandrium_andersonii.AAC.1